MGPLGEIEALGFGALWLGGSPSLVEARVPRGDQHADRRHRILNVWRHEPADVAAAHADLRREFGERFLLGVGIGHPEATSEYAKPLTKMRDFLDGLDSADPPVPREERVVAALGRRCWSSPRSARSARTPTSPRSSTRASPASGSPGALLAPELAVVVDPDPERGREHARAFAASYLRMTNYAATCCGSASASTSWPTAAATG